MINLFVTHTVKPHQLYRLVLLFTVTVLMYVGSTAQKYVDIRTDVCARIEKRNNGNGQYGNCAGIGGNAIAENVIGTSFATIVRNKGINKLIPASIAANRFVIRFKPATTLPVDIINIKANKNGEAVNVDWTTANEINMRNYDVERSADGKEFTRLAAVQAKGGLANSYQITDQSPLNGNNYYRIKGTDQNGTVKYSAIAKVNMSRAADIKVYPNPVKNNTIRLLTSGLPEGNYTVELVNGIGQKLYVAKLVQQQSANAIIQLPKTILPGMYSLKLSSEHTTVTTRVILE